MREIVLYSVLCPVCPSWLREIAVLGDKGRSLKRSKGKPGVRMRHAYLIKRGQYYSMTVLSSKYYNQYQRIIVSEE
jgi:hypothetical protein